MPSAPKRRWLRFSLRTLFVGMTLAGAALWLGADWNWVRQRHAALNELHVGVCIGPQRVIVNNMNLSLHDLSAETAGGGDVQAPWNIRLLGEPAASKIIVYEPHDERYVAKLRRLFPEAIVSLRDPVPTRSNPSQSALDTLQRNRAND